MTSKPERANILRPLLLLVLVGSAVDGTSLPSETAAVNTDAGRSASMCTRGKSDAAAAAATRSAGADGAARDIGVAQLLVLFSAAKLPLAAPVLPIRSSDGSRTAKRRNASETSLTRREWLASTARE